MELISSGFTDSQARAISLALKTAQETSLKDLLTKSDLKQEISRLSERITHENAKLSDRITLLDKE